MSEHITVEKWIEKRRLIVHSTVQSGTRSDSERKLMVRSKREVIK